MDTITKPTTKPNTPVPNQHPAVLSETLKPTEDWSVSGQGSEEAVPPSLSEVSNRKNKLALPKWFLENQTVAVRSSSLTEQSVDNTSRFSYDQFYTTFSEEPASPGTIGSEVLPLSPSGVLPQNLVTFLESSLSSHLQRNFEVTGDAAASLPVSMTGELLSSPDLLPLAGVTTATVSASHASSLLSDVPEVLAADVTSTLTISAQPAWDPPFMSAGFHTGDSRPPTGDPWSPTDDPHPPRGDPRPPTGVHQSELPLPDQVVQTRPSPLSPSLNLSSPPLSSFITSSVQLTRHHMTLDSASSAWSFPVLTLAGLGQGPAGPGIPDQTSSLDFPPPTPGSGFPSSSSTHDPFVFKLLPPAESAKHTADTVDSKTIPGSNRTVWKALKDWTKAEKATKAAAHVDGPQVTTRGGEAAALPAMSAGTSEHPTASSQGSSPGQSRDRWTGSPDDFFLTSAALFDQRHFTATTKSKFPAAPVKAVDDGVVTPPVSGSGTTKHPPECPCKQRSQCPCGPLPGNST